MANTISMCLLCCFQAPPETLVPMSSSRCVISCSLSSCNQPNTRRQTEPVSMNICDRLGQVGYSFLCVNFSTPTIILCLGCKGKPFPQIEMLSHPNLSATTQLKLRPFKESWACNAVTCLGATKICITNGASQQMQHRFLETRTMS